MGISQIEILAGRIPGAAAEVRKLGIEDIAALNTLMLEAKISHIQPPAFEVQSTAYYETFRKAARM